MPRTVCIAAAQSVPVDGDVSANVAAHVTLLEASRHARPSLVVFPELSLTGYTLPQADALALTPGDERLNPLREAARRHDTVLVVGAPVRVAQSLHIGAFILSPDGGLALYTKHHLGAFGASAAVDGVVPPAEATAFMSGRCDPRVEGAWGVAAVAICADVGHPQHARAAAQHGATLYLASMFVIPSQIGAERVRLAQRATDHRLAILVANFGGPSGGLASAGTSAFWTPDGTEHARLPTAGPGLVLAHQQGEHWRCESFVP